ncbi:MAG TPA: XrtB/PEP-CTERM-associated transcriptional regulator EpsA [Methylophilaceae bacterium]|jgi:transcriptional regulator EpsA|nr:XrtB/PEP-CTERM-associated transcriptional regulator EpsA [Methylophilaceae bacterium]
MIKFHDGLNAEQRSTYMEVIDASLRVRQREQLFSWLQGYCQYLIPHEVMLCGVRSDNEQDFVFELFVSTRYVTDQHIQVATQKPDGLITRVMSSWRTARRPILVAEGMAPGDYGSHLVPFEETAEVLRNSELRNIAAHGLGTQEGAISTFFCFSRIPSSLGPHQAYMLELLVPHLHAMLTRVIGYNNYPVDTDKPISPITSREREILQWVHCGKTNWEIAHILEISPLTVKNHVQNILRKLNVQNRSHAAAKASKIGLVKN